MHKKTIKKKHDADNYANNIFSGLSDYDDLFLAKHATSLSAWVYDLLSIGIVLDQHNFHPAVQGTICGGIIWPDGLIIRMSADKTRRASTRPVSVRYRATLTARSEDSSQFVGNCLERLGVSSV